MRTFLSCAALPFALMATLACTQPATAQVAMTGVNMAGAEFSVPGQKPVYGKNYSYPEPEWMVYFLRKGMNVFRVPFRWGRVQPQLYEDLDPFALGKIDALVAFAATNGASIILSPHDFGRYKGQMIGTKEVPAEALGDLWRRLAERYKNNPRVIFGLMNEPHGISSLKWLGIANATIAVIRETGAQNLILVPGNNWTTAGNWFRPKVGPSNSAVMGGVRDSGNNFAIEVHQYFDSDFSGRHFECPDQNIGVRTLSAFTRWLREKKLRAFLGEFGAAGDPGCLTTIENTLRFMDENSDAWMGWTYWAAGRRWRRDYPFHIEPFDGQDKPQMSVLSRFLRGNARP